MKNPKYIEYHDNEWCKPRFDDKYLYEMLILESFQAGLSWECVLNKRESFRKAYDNFEIDKVCAYDDEKINELLNNKEIIRNKLKIDASINNSKIFKEITLEYGSFYKYLKNFAGDGIIYETDKTTNDLSDAISNDLRKRGMKFVGSTIIYSYLQAIGLIYSHEKECYMYKGLEWTFDTVASAYERLRPGYVAELYKTIFNYIEVDENSNVLEIGSGGGQATAPMLMTGCKLTAVECGEHFSKLLKEKFKEIPTFSVITDKFENTQFKDNMFDLVFSASAFHWIPEKIGYEKVFKILKSGGVFARFANHPYRDKGNSKLSAEIDEIYDEYYNRFHNKKREVLTEYTEAQAKDCALIAEKYGFTDIQYALFHRERVFSAKEYIELLGTYSDHIAIEETIRRRFFSKIEEAINRHGGEITIYDTIDLQLARKC